MDDQEIIVIKFKGFSYKPRNKYKSPIVVEIKGESTCQLKKQEKDSPDIINQSEPLDTEQNPTLSLQGRVGKERLIRFGQQGVKGAGKNPKSAKDKARKKSYYARHNAQGKPAGPLSAKYWSHKVKW